MSETDDEVNRSADEEPFTDAYGRGQPGKVNVPDVHSTPTIRDWYDYGCCNLCRGRPENVKSMKCEYSEPDAIFQCPMCTLLFHADCVNFTQSERDRVMHAPDGKHVCLCPSCLTGIVGIYDFAAEDTAALLKGLSAALHKLSSRKPVNEEVLSAFQEVRPTICPTTPAFHTTSMTGAPATRC